MYEGCNQFLTKSELTHLNCNNFFLLAFLFKIYLKGCYLQNATNKEVHALMVHVYETRRFKTQWCLSKILLIPASNWPGFLFKIEYVKRMSLQT